MKRLWGILRAVGIGLVLGGIVYWWRSQQGVPSNIDEVRRRVEPRLKRELRAEGFALGNPLFIRIFKESRELEVWLLPSGAAKYRLFRSYNTMVFSGKLGPKLAEGDGQAPEGFYEVNAGALNPNSTFHFSFNIGYPNEFDMANGRTGSFIMVHGGAASVGCFAMTDAVIEEIYLICEAALRSGQASFPVHVFPFRMSPERLQEEEDASMRQFWNELREGYEIFENARMPPGVRVINRRYLFNSVGS